MQRVFIDNKGYSKLTLCYQIHVQWAPNNKGYNALHLTALCAGTGVMQLLAGADLGGLDPLARDEYGDTPNACFYYHRQRVCSIVREPFAAEEKAWRTLMDSACRQNGIVMPIFNMGGNHSDTDISSDGDDIDEDSGSEDFFDAPDSFVAELDCEGPVIE